MPVNSYQLTCAKNQYPLHFVVGVVPVGGDEEVVVVGGVVAGLGQDVVAGENDSRTRRRLAKNKKATFQQ